MKVLRTLRRGLNLSVKRCKASFQEAFLDDWWAEVTTLEAKALHGGGPWWFKHAKPYVPKWVFHQCLFRSFDNTLIHPSRPPGPAYGTIGNRSHGHYGGKAGYLECIEGKMGVFAGEAVIPRLIKTREGRVVLQHTLYAEREAAARAAADAIVDKEGVGAMAKARAEWDEERPKMEKELAEMEKEAADETAS